MSDDTELPPLDADPDEWDDKWHEPTTITVHRWVKASLDHDRDGQPWNDYLESLRRHKADPLTLTDARQISEAIMDEMDVPDILDRLDDLEARLPRKVAEEVEQTSDGLRAFRRAYFKRKSTGRGEGDG